MGVNASYLFSVDRVGERSCANAVNIAAVIDKTAGCFDGLLGAWISPEEVRSVFPILNVPCHRNTQSAPPPPQLLSSCGFYSFVMGVACPVARVRLSIGMGAPVPTTTGRWLPGKPT